jgi:hypothetical protein
LYDSGQIRFADVQLRAQSARIANIEQRQSMPGPQGPAGPLGPMPVHEWRGTELRFQQGPEGDTWGPYVDLKGPSGGTAQPAYGVAVINQNENSYMPSGW